MRLHRFAADRLVDRQPVTGHQKVTVTSCDEVLDGWGARDLRQAALEILGGPVSRTVGARDLELRRKHAADSLLLAARERTQPRTERLARLSLGIDHAPESEIGEGLHLPVSVDPREDRKTRQARDIVADALDRAPSAREEGRDEGVARRGRFDAADLVGLQRSWVREITRPVIARAVGPDQLEAVAQDLG